jgi:hypothetical protein
VEGIVDSGRPRPRYSGSRETLGAESGESLASASVRSVDLEHVERVLRDRLDALGPAPRAELLHVLMHHHAPRLATESRVVRVPY